MAYETCPQCGARKHQLVACPQCGFKRLARAHRPTLELPEEPPAPLKEKVAAPPPVSSNFEICPHCGQRKHLLMACSGCGFSRSGNHERRPKIAVVKPPRPHSDSQPHPVINSRYDDRYYERNLIDEDSYFPVMPWKRPRPFIKKNPDKAHAAPNPQKSVF